MKEWKLMLLNATESNVEKSSCCLQHASPASSTLVLEAFNCRDIENAMLISNILFSHNVQKVYSLNLDKFRILSSFHH